jgi:ABC-type Mn2+/Zn2+ transport system ATPase subunit
MKPAYPPGARWWKFDFHTHTPGSLDTEAWQKARGAPDEVTPERWLLRFMEAGVDCVAITDHNSGAWVDKLKDAYARLQADPSKGFRPLHLFPGVEISVNGGFHLLAILDQDKTTADMDTLRGRVGYGGTKGDSDGVTRKSAVEVIEAVVAAGGLPIPAHADQSKGLLRLKDGGGAVAVIDANTLRQVLECRDILATEILERSWSKPAVYQELAVRWTEVLGSDCHSFQGQNVPGSRYAWVKMAEPSLEGLRLALLDGPGFSIRRSDDPEAFDPFALPEHFVEAIEIANARYMGREKNEKLRFSPWFNAIVGGRGTGKSTVVHCLRLGYRRDGELKKLGEESEARRTFERFARVAKSRADEGGLQDDTEILITLMRDGVGHRLRWRQDGEGTVVEEEANGDWRSSTSQIVAPERFPVRVLSQAQIAALAGESQEALLAVIDEAAGSGSAKAALEETKQRFFALRAQIRELDGKLKGRDQVQVQLEDVRRKLARFEEAHHAEVLKEYQLRARQEREIERRIHGADEMAARVRQLADELVPEDLPQGLFDVQGAADREALAIVERLKQAVNDAAGALRESAKRLSAAAQKQRDALPASAWHAAVVRAKQGFAALVETLKAQGVTDPSEYGKLVQDRQRLESEAADLDALARQQRKLAADAEQQRTHVCNARRALSEKRRGFLTNALAQNPHVRIELLPYGRDSKAIERSLREVLGVTDDRFDDDILVLKDDTPTRGAVANLIEKLPRDAPGATQEIEHRIESLAQRFDKACAGQGDFGGHFNNYLQRECQRRPELLDRLLVWSPDDALRVEYSPTGDGTDFRPSGPASAGQRAAAMLAFLLAHGDEPLVLDQPEDDLDNHLIYDLVVRQIRANKLRRQIIVVTHNPNIVVNGDAEMLHALDFTRGQCRVVQAGSLQERAMREEICRVMEGGREAFERRYQRLGREV